MLYHPKDIPIRVRSVRKPLLLIAVPILASVWALVGAQDSWESSSLTYPQGPDAIPLLQEVWDISAENLYPAHLAKRFDAGTLEKLEDRLRKARNLALADVLNPFLERLNVSHTRFYDLRHQSYYMLRSLFSTRNLDSPKLYTIGVQLDEYEPALVRAVLEGSPAAVAGVRRGDRIIAVDDVQFESLLQWQQAASTRLLLRRHGEEREITLTPILQSFHRALARATRASWEVLACGDRSIGYLHLWSGTHSVFMQILESSIADTREMNLDGFILDLRDGYGGAWWTYLDPFYSDRSEYFIYKTRDARGTTNAVQADPQTNDEAWTGPLAVIINSGTRSGKESLAFQFKKDDRATLFGTTTAGAFTAGRGVFADREADYIFYLSVQEFILDGTAIEGNGITPDVVVEGDAERDRPLTEALDHFEC